MTHPPPPVAAGAVGSPAAAAARLRADVQGFLDEAEAVAGREIVPRHAAALVVPYDPHPLAGPTAGVGFAAVDVPARCVVVTTVGARPNRRGGGGVEVGRPHATAIGDVPHDAQLAASLVGAPGAWLEMAPADGAAPDEALDVLLPFIQVRNPEARVVTLRLASDDWDVVRSAAAALRAAAHAADDLLVIGASNLTRDAAGDQRKDRDALLLEHVISLNGAAVLDLVRRGGIVMSGAPAVAFACEYARLCGAQGGQLVAYSHSGIVTGREDRVTAAQAAARDAAAIADGVPARALMRCAGMGAAAQIASRYRTRLAHGAAIFAGPGNNGGDAWVVAGALAAAGVPVRVAEASPPRTADAAAERAAVVAQLPELSAPTGAERVVVDGLLGTGATGAPRGALAEHVARVNGLRAAGAAVVSLDLPSGIDATTGRADGAHVVANLTITFGTMKRGLLLARAAAGRVVVLDIGLGACASLDDGAPELVDAGWVARRVPPVPADAHKGTRKRVAIVGGGAGMAGAAVLAARGAFRSGVGLVRLLVAPESVAAVQAAAPDAIAARWPASAAGNDAGTVAQLLGAVDAVAIGPGLGRTAESRRLVEAVLAASAPLPVVLDADALNVFEGDAGALGSALGGRPALVTPHPAEFARLAGGDVAGVLASRFEAAPDLASRLGACVLLKGVPTVVASPLGARAVCAAGTPALAVAGSGDVLTGVALTLLAQTGDPFAAAACAAWAHGRAGELACERGVPHESQVLGSASPRWRSTRGVTLDDVIGALARAWPATYQPPPSPLLAELPPVGEEAMAP